MSFQVFSVQRLLLIPHGTNETAFLNRHYPNPTPSLCLSAQSSLAIYASVLPDIVEADFREIVIRMLLHKAASIGHEQE